MHELPYVQDFDIGTGTADRTIGVAVMDRPQSLIVGTLKNDGEVNMTLSALRSRDNGMADAFVALNFRQGATTGATIVVVPGGVADFTLDALGDNEKYIRFKVAETLAVGKLSLQSRSKMSFRSFIGVP